MSRLQRIRIQEESANSIPEDERPDQEAAPKEFLGPFIKSNTMRLPAYEPIGTSWRKLLGDPSFLDVVAEQGIDGE
jgi:hypothetical protein